MTSERAIITECETPGRPELANRPLQRAGIDRAFLTAHLLAGNIAMAELAVLQAVKGWRPNDGEPALFSEVVRAALSASDKDRESSVNDHRAEGSALPPELQAVLRLSPQLRQCYVLRLLAGMSRDACARILELSTQRVDQYTCAALQRLPLV